MSIKKVPTAILISGRGSNMDSLIKAASNTDYPAEIVLVISNRPKAKGIEKAKAQGIPVKVIDHKQFDTREAFDDAINLALKAAKVDLVCNAGFMRLLTKGFVDKWQNRLLNIHPSLLPSFKGLDTHQRAIEAGVKITGCTVHFIRFEMDTGPIIAQAAVPILPDDTTETLANRVLQQEHIIYPEALKLVASGEVRVSGEKTVFSQNYQESLPLRSPNIG